MRPHHARLQHWLITGVLASALTLGSLCEPARATTDLFAFAVPCHDEGATTMQQLDQVMRAMGAKRPPHPAIVRAGLLVRAYTTRQWDVSSTYFPPGFYGTAPALALQCVTHDARSAEALCRTVAQRYREPR